ncbi:MAG: type II toxin-antitoxin system RelE/ParE family toxin [Ignavibacteriales bacterium]|nr:type II toxin-antitoxin system RelE/ParE family toxin [Ignavibacteriales bacterium]
MAYKLIIKPSAQKDLDKLPDKEVIRLAPKIFLLSQNPRTIGTQKLTEQEGYRIRIGNYRVLYEIDDSTKSIFVFRIKHRKEVYKKKK